MDGAVFVAGRIYRDGRAAEPVDLDQSREWTFDRGDFVWIGLVEPREKELRILADRFGLHPLAIEHALSEHRLPKLETYGDQLFVVARTASLTGQEMSYGETAIFVGRQFIITVRHGSERTHADLRQRLETFPEGMRSGVAYVLHAVLDYVVDGYGPVIEAIEEEVLSLEGRVLDVPLSKDDVRVIFAYRRQLARFGRMLQPTLEVSARLQHLDLPCVEPALKPYFRDVEDHVRRVAGRVEGLRDVLRSVFEIGLLMEQQRQSVVTRKLAAWAAILAIPTAIAGVYGMNFEYMPELHLRYGYYVVLICMLTICGLLYLRFKRIEWL
ncbi:magnesium and cobalt transport protein CorA [Lichenibacterium minor]|uniref:Magnesium and cobalt transport protein CorA n=1 Tax=Lichenibacterium minor TaxID=2316528 RepID=A0A4Q2U3E7_9HYPH|nr:magnesium and cobalt transport protein CorA [Lichenibacterium minor]